MINQHIGELLREIRLPKPHSVNAALAPGYVRTRKYRQWQRDAQAEIMTQGPRLLIEGPVFLDLIFPAGACPKNCDTDNQTKCCIDCLVDMGILIDDNRTIVPVVLARWGPGKKTLVRIFRFLGEVL